MICIMFDVNGYALIDELEKGMRYPAEVTGRRHRRPPGPRLIAIRCGLTEASYTELQFNAIETYPRYMEVAVCRL